MRDTIPAAGRTLNPASTARVAMHPLHPMLVPFPIAFFTGALFTDVAYWKTAEMMWADFSAWLLFAGLVMGVLAALAGFIDFLSNRLIRGLSSAWLHMMGVTLISVTMIGGGPLGIGSGP
jgi:uncharacterized membrane protein